MSRGVCRRLDTVIDPNDTTTRDLPHLAVATRHIITHRDNDVAAEARDPKEEPLRETPKVPRSLPLTGRVIINDDAAGPRPSQLWIDPAPRWPIDEVYDPDLLAPNELTYRAA
jgi:hypothetical protein